MTEPHPLQPDFDAYGAQKDVLEEHHMGKFVVFHDGEFIDAFDSFDHAAREAAKRFGRGPYLIRQVGADRSMAMPASIAFRPIHAPN